MQVEAPSSQEPTIIMHRVFDAPREIVWNVFTDPKHVAKWFGGHGFENPVCEMDVRPGGLWRHVMRTPDGSEFPIEYVFVEVVRPEKLVWQDRDHGKRPAGGPPTSVSTVTLEDAGKQTRWTFVARFASVADRDHAAKMGFSHTITEGCEKFNEIAKALARS